MAEQNGGGRPKIYHPCPYCRKKQETGKMLKHLNECPKRSKRKAA